MFLQATSEQVLTNDLYWIIGATIVLGIVFFLTKKYQYDQRAKQMNRNDPRSLISNTSSYNINKEQPDVTSPMPTKDELEVDRD